MLFILLFQLHNYFYCLVYIDSFFFFFFGFFFFFCFRTCSLNNIHFCFACVCIYLLCQQKQSQPTTNNHLFLFDLCLKHTRTDCIPTFGISADKHRANGNSHTRSRRQRPHATTRTALLCLAPHVSQTAVERADCGRCVVVVVVVDIVHEPVGGHVVVVALQRATAARCTWQHQAHRCVRRRHCRSVASSSRLRRWRRVSGQS